MYGLTRNGEPSMRASHRVLATVIAVAVWIFAGYAIGSAPRAMRANMVSAPLAATCTPATLN